METPLSSQTINALKSNSGNSEIEFSIHSLENEDINSIHNYMSIKRSQCYELLWIESGGGEINVDFKSFSLQPNTLLCVGPYQLRTLQLKEQSKGYFIRIPNEYVHLSDCQMNLSLLLAKNKGVLFFRISEKDMEMETILIQMHSEFLNSTSFRSEILRAYLKVFLLYFCRIIKIEGKDVRTTNDFDLVVRFFDLLKIQFRFKKFVSDYADELCITPNYLNSIIKKQTGFPVRHHIQQHLIMEAKRQAFNSGLRMKEVADYLGFDDYAHFSKFFKNYSGVNYTDFKKDLLLG